MGTDVARSIYWGWGCPWVKGSPCVKGGWSELHGGKEPLGLRSRETRCIVSVSNELFSRALHFNLLSRSPDSHSSILAGSTHTTITPHRPKKRVWRTRGGRPFEEGEAGGTGNDTWLYSLHPLYLLSPYATQPLTLIFNSVY